MAYIASSDITDTLVNQFSTSFATYHTLTDLQMVDIAEQLGITDSDDIDTDGSGYVSSFFIKQYLVAWFCMRLLFDKMGINNVAFDEQEKYRVKYEYYRHIVKDKEKKITYEMVTGNVDEIGDRSSGATSGLIFRG